MIDPKARLDVEQGLEEVLDGLRETIKRSMDCESDIAFPLAKAVGRAAWILAGCLDSLLEDEEDES